DHVDFIFRINDFDFSQILTDTIKGNDRIIDRISDDGQDRGDECDIHFKAEYREHGNHYECIMQECKHCRQTHAPFEPEGCIEDDADCRQGKGKHGILSKCLTDDRTHGTDHRVGTVKVREPFLHACHLLLRQIGIVPCSEAVIAGSRNAGRRDVHLFKLLFHLLHCGGTVCCDIRSCAACKVDAEVQPEDG